MRTGLHIHLGLALAMEISTPPPAVSTTSSTTCSFDSATKPSALRQFARELAYIDAPDVVLAHTVETVAHAVELRCALLLTTAEGFRNVATSAGTDRPEVVDRNDGAAVRLLATREPVELHNVHCLAKDAEPAAHRVHYRDEVSAGESRHRSSR